MDNMSEKNRNTCRYIYIFERDVLVSIIQKMASDNERAREKKERERENMVINHIPKMLYLIKSNGWWNHP